MIKRSKILIIDDSEFDRKLLDGVLTKKGYICTHCDNGKNALITIKTEKPDLVLLDIMMPGIDGIETLELIRKQYTTIQLPIIMVTSKTDDSEVINALQKGANDYITKPVHYDIAIMRISTQLQLIQNTRQQSTIQEIKAINAMITTYNHEINNPITIAIMALSLFEKTGNKDHLSKIKVALDRVANIVKQIDKVTTENIEYDSYTQNTAMIKLKKTSS